MSSSQKWANDILGLGYTRNRGQPHHQNSLEVEVEAYLNDSNVGASSLNFWQVCSIHGIYDVDIIVLNNIFIVE